MFFTIFKYELQYWFKKPAYYVYAIIFFLLSIFIAASSAGIFDGLTVTTGSSKIVNAPIAVNGIFNSMAIFLFFLFPSIIGASVFRDYKNPLCILNNADFNIINISVKYEFIDILNCS